MRAEERHNVILHLLNSHGQVTIADLSVRFAVSEMTVRRDLDQLAAKGALRRTHGGAARVSSGGVEPPFAVRAHLNAEAKRRIGRAVAGLLVDGQTVLLDGGSTAVAVADALVGRDLTICTPSLHVAEVLADSRPTRVMVTGGVIRPGERALYGPATLRTLADHRFDAYVMTASGLDLSAGCTEWNTDDAATKRTGLEVSSTVIAACDSSKAGQVAFARICGLDDLDVLVTDDGLSPDHQAALRGHRLDLHLA
ncbi:DeoR/GlpR family DNA-binding transcription regulator [Bailinhaonella thermotolerans]|uniref:Lactose phosphotransferase system repressor n=1 Tax=Bailinhaonella thermotolerans TaxID=1070861 RepID=A0A3A4A338_9ACTN|nr:DeoR/GlpR family DNA-binding transcription regulator [Bailinhaonella thermotolerans]RJL23176.1 DeoR/GlpR transcriptional regulator [Bailinhaonella thermotolerans]